MSDSGHSDFHSSDHEEVSPDVQVQSPVASADREREHSPEDALDIKPPQSHAGRKDRHKHKHRHKESDRSRERKHGERDRGRRDPRDRDRERERNRDKRKERENSEKERERLERLERERTTRDRERMMHESDRRHREKDSWKDRGHDAWRDNRVADQRRQKDHRRIEKRLGRSRSRSPRRVVSSQESQSTSKQSRNDSPKQEGKSLPPPASPDDDEDKMPMEQDKEVESEEESVEEVSGSEASAGNSGNSVSEESGEASGSENSDEGSESEEEEEVEEDKKNSESKEGKVRSKFDDQPSSSEEEEEEEEAEKSEDESTHSSNKEDVAYMDDSPPVSPVILKPELPPYFPAIQGCRNVEEFNCLNRIEEGTYGVVYRAIDKKTGQIVALKRLKMEKEKEGFPITSLREINTLLKAQHSNIVTVREIVVGHNMDKIYIVMDYVEHDLKSLMESMKDPFLIGEVKTLIIQLLRAVEHMHDNWILHRDLKTSNLLLSHKGILKVGDFGLAREYGSPLKHYTPIVVTLWYRSPELLLGAKEYSTAVDMWSVGCIFAEFLTMKPLWPGKSEIDQLNRIFKELGTPSEKIWPKVSELPAMKKCTFADYPYNTLRNRFGSQLTDGGFELLNRFLTYNPSKRITAEEALKNEYFNESPLPINPSMFPTWPAKSEQPRKHMSTPKPPSGGKAYAQLFGDGDDDTIISGSSGFFRIGAGAKGPASGGPGFSLKF